MSGIAFFTVCGGGEEYEFLLGSITYHAGLGRHFVLDVSEPPNTRQFSGLPDSVVWHHRPGYGSGDWKTFRMVSALEDARRAALEAFPDVDFLVQLDCDEYYDVRYLRQLLVRGEGLPKVAIFNTIHWKDGRALAFGPSEMHLRAWDTRIPIVIGRNSAWKSSPRYNGNEEHHPIPMLPDVPFKVNPIFATVHYHVHYDLGEKNRFTETAETTIDGWPNGTPVSSPCPWPEPLLRWKYRRILPSIKFS